MSELVIGALSNAQFKVSENVDDMTVDAIITVDGNKNVTTFNDGHCICGEMVVATFSAYGSESLNINFNDYSKIAQSSSAIVAFINTVRANIPNMELEF